MVLALLWVLYYDTLKLIFAAWSQRSETITLISLTLYVLSQLRLEKIVSHWSWLASEVLPVIWPSSDLSAALRCALMIGDYSRPLHYTYQVSWNITFDNIEIHYRSILSQNLLIASCTTIITNDLLFILLHFQCTSLCLTAAGRLYCVICLRGAVCVTNGILPWEVSKEMPLDFCRQEPPITLEKRLKSFSASKSCNKKFTIMKLTPF